MHLLNSLVIILLVTSLNNHARRVNFSAAGGGGGSSSLLYSNSLEYLGAFRVPNYSDGQGEFSFGRNRIALSSSADSMFVSGNYNSLIEISIPALLTGAIGGLNVATTIQTWRQRMGDLPNPLVNAGDGEWDGGLMVYNGKLIGTLFAYYSGANEQTISHWVIDDPDDLAGSFIHGLYSVGSYGRFAAGYIAEIPAEHQTALGGKAVSGLCGYPINTTDSNGPAAYAYDPALLTGSEPGTMPAEDLLHYLSATPLGPYSDAVSPIQNGTTLVDGCVFIPGTDTVLFFGHTATSWCGYGTPIAYGDPNSDGGTGPQSLNGEYMLAVWAYDVNDLASVKNGDLDPNDLLPYSVWRLDLPYVPGRIRVGGVTFDAATSTLYIAMQKSDTEHSFAYLPVIHGIHVNTSAVETGPKIASLTAVPQSITPGPIAAGETVDLVAGCVYAKAGKTISSVAFEVDSVFVGYGALYPTANYLCEIDTTGMSSGSHTVEAIALDSDGLTHSRTYTMEIA